MVRKDGFTLIEVLIALAIVAVGVMAVMRAIGVASGGIEQLRMRQMAEWVAQNRLAEMRVRGVYPPPGANEGSVVMGRANFFWREEIKATPNPLFRRVDVSVFETPGDSHALARLSGFAVQPLQ